MPYLKKQKTKQFYLEEFSFVNLKNIFKKIQIYIDAKIWGEGDKRLCAKMRFDLILFISSFLLSFLLAPDTGLFPSYCGSSSPSVSWEWFSSRLLTSEDIIWHQDHSCFWALRLRLRLITHSFSLELSSEASFFWSYFIFPRLYFRSLSYGFQILACSLKEDLLDLTESPSLYWWPRILLFPYSQAGNFSSFLPSWTAVVVTFFAPLSHVLESSGVDCSLVPASSSFIQC